MKQLLPLLSICAALFLSGCVSYQSALPENYTGPVASLEDSVTVQGASKCDFFVVLKVNGREIQNSLDQTQRDNYGRGFVMSSTKLSRDIPTGQITVELLGRTAYAAPILALTHSAYQVSGSVTFTAEEGKTYVVKGRLLENNCVIWVEDKETKKPVTEKIKAKGSGKLGFFEK